MHNETGHLSRSGFVTLLVGEDKTPFHVHKDLICSNSELFKDCFERNFSEAENRIVSVPDDNVDAVETFVTRLYSGQIDYDGLRASVDSLVTTFTFGDKVLPKRVATTS